MVTGEASVRGDLASRRADPSFCPSPASRGWAPFYICVRGRGGEMFFQTFLLTAFSFLGMV